MGKFKFNLEVGIGNRSYIRTMLNNSKQKLEYHYGGNVSIVEEKGFFVTTFYVVGLNFPDSDEFSNDIHKWMNKLKNI